MSFHPITLYLIMFAGSFTQSFAGFGMALVAMPLLTQIMSIRTASPLLSLFAMTTQTILVMRYRRTINVKVILPLLIGAWVGVPLGIYGLKLLDERLVTFALGLVIAGYALYAMFAPRLPEIRNPRWAYGFGLIAGMFSGAYNASGPPVVIYGSCCKWEPLEFRSNLMGFFWCNTLYVVILRYLGGDYTSEIARTYLAVVPVVLLGMVTGLLLDKRVSPALFRKIVLVLLVGLGIQLML
jgi:hypothetical protein